MKKEQILYEDNDIIVCYKPAGIATQTARVGQRDMVSEVANYLSGNGSPYVGCIHRLDQPVEGILVFARNRKAAAELGRQITENRMEKYYYAVVSESGTDTAEETGWNRRPESERKPDTDPGQGKALTDYLLKDAKTNMSRIVSPKAEGAKKAVLEYEILERKRFLFKNVPEARSGEGDQAYAALVRVRLITGRHHQIRVQMSHAGMCLLGDYKYADERTKKLSAALDQKQVALCAYRLDLIHPATGKRMSFRKEPQGLIFQNFSKQISDKIS